jgi:hypothetical protein
VRPLRRPSQTPNEPPFFRGSVSSCTVQAAGLVPSKGHYRCGTVPGFHRTSLQSVPLQLCWNSRECTAIGDLPADGEIRYLGPPFFSLLGGNQERPSCARTAPQLGSEGRTSTACQGGGEAAVRGEGGLIWAKKTLTLSSGTPGITPHLTFCRSRVICLSSLPRCLTSPRSAISLTQRLLLLASGVESERCSCGRRIRRRCVIFGGIRNRFRCL